MRQVGDTPLTTTTKQRWRTPPTPVALDATEAAEWSLVIADRLGLYFAPERLQFLTDRLWSRVQALGLGSPALYRAYLLSHPAEWDILADAIVVNESRFFREESLFRALTDHILPQHVRRREQTSGRRELAVWSAGCSTGEEAYTLAMTALETLPLPSLWDLQVLGTDLAESNLRRAREGIYEPRRLEGLPQPWFERYVEACSGGRVRMRAAARAVTTFRQHNLCGDIWPIGPQDVIACLNVIIYFRREDQLSVLNRLYDTLRPGGYLLVGATELPTVPIRPGVTPIRVGDALAYHRAI
jgi:chemotaxis methyl-accepting protein methylase